MPADALDEVDVDVPAVGVRVEAEALRGTADYVADKMLATDLSKAPGHIAAISVAGPVAARVTARGGEGREEGGEEEELREKLHGVWGAGASW